MAATIRHSFVICHSSFVILPSDHYPLNPLQAMSIILPFLMLLMIFAVVATCFYRGDVEQRRFV